MFNVMLVPLVYSSTFREGIYVHYLNAQERSFLGKHDVRDKSGEGNKLFLRQWKPYLTSAIIPTF